MMGRQPRQQQKLFYNRLNLEKRIRRDHPLRAIEKCVNFDFVYNEVKDRYGQNGNVSVPPPVILKMMLLLILYNVRSERELMDTIPERLDWMWFLGYDLDNDIPNHSVLSKARARWGVNVFQSFFERIVSQCALAGLVDGTKLFMDSSDVRADASNNSVVNQHDIKRYLKDSYRRFEKRLEYENSKPADDDFPKSGSANSKYFSTTDPDASVHRQGGGRSRLMYKVHRSVDDRHEIITATEVTSGSVNEAHLLGALMDQHEKTTGIKPLTCVADSKYGTIENYLNCCERNINPHFESFEKAHRGSGRQKGIFAKEEFVYRADTDTFICPQGEELSRRRFNNQRQQWEYGAPIAVCKECSFFSQCTKSKAGRSLKRHLRQDDLDKMYSLADSRESKRDIKRRQHLMERTFARGSRYGFKRARWRRRWRVKIQELVTATIQNILVYIGYFKERSRAQAARACAGTSRSWHCGQFDSTHFAWTSRFWLAKSST